MGTLGSWNTIKIVQEASYSIQEDTIDVFTKLENMYNLDWKDQEDTNGTSCNPGKMWELYERLLGSVDDYHDRLPYLGVNQGLVTVVNCNA